MTSRQAIGAAAGVALSVLLLWLLLRGVSVSRWLDALAGVPPRYWIVATLGLLASYALRALRLLVEWQPQVRGIRFADTLRLMLLHNAAVNVVPMRAGEAGYAWIVHRQWGVPLADAVASLLWLRLQDVAILAAFAIAWLLPVSPVTGAALALIWVASYALMSPRLGGLLALTPWRPLQKVGAYTQRPGQQAWRQPASLACALANWAMKLGVLGGVARGARRRLDRRRAARQPRRRARGRAAGARAGGPRHVRGRCVGRRRPARAGHLARPRRRRRARRPSARPRRRPRRGARRAADDALLAARGSNGSHAMITTSSLAPGPTSTASSSMPLTTSSAPAHRLSVVVPMYNEIENAAPLIDAVQAALAGYPSPWEMIVVDDGSRDGTGDAARAPRRDRGPHMRVVRFAPQLRPDRGDAGRHRRRRAATSSSRWTATCRTTRPTSRSCSPSARRGLRRGLRLARESQGRLRSCASCRRGSPTG